MTLLEVRNQIVYSLCQSQTGTFGRDQFGSIKVADELADHHDNLVRAALAELVLVGFIREIDKDLWILSNPLQAAGQPVHVSIEIANEVANTLNLWIKGEELDVPLVDPLHLHEGHLILLLQCIDDLLDDLSNLPVPPPHDS